MYEFHPYFTNDGSVGLYNSDYNDIYHSAKGALTEAYEKFILPVDFDKLMSKPEIKVLDICYGIGYNSKSFLNYVFENYCKKNFLKNSILTNHNIEAIYTNNIFKHQDNNSHPHNSNYNDTIDTNNIIPRISITAVDNDKILALLSPFIQTGVRNFKNDNLDFHYNLEKYFTAQSHMSSNKISDLINFLIFEKLLENTSELLENDELNSILKNNKYKSYFNSKLKGIYEFNKRKVNKCAGTSDKPTILHNIYYKYVSECYKNGLKRYNLQEINFYLKIDDARKVILENNELFNLIFLDAFTPSKCPCLWSYEFFIELYKHLSDDGLLLTYSTSASIRGAMLEAGFQIGNIYNQRENKFTGTIAVKDKNLIKYPLSEFDLGLIKTRAGIFYRDKNLTGLNEAIIEERNLEVKNSSQITSSQYKKSYKESL